MEARKPAGPMDARVGTIKSVAALAYSARPRVSSCLAVVRPGTASSSDAA
ncbi:MAG: hypothetical protein GX139_12950 [Armatimonadetes bacterium]|nr:hypothetical protein [Armatimonadota bacterium]